MKKMYKENGLLSEEGDRVFREMLDAKINAILGLAEDESELRIIGSLLQSRIGDAISNKLQAKREITNKLISLTDEQFYAYLKGKYGDRWMLCTLTKEEFARCPDLTKEQVSASLEEGRKAREAATISIPAVRIDRNTRYR